MYKYLFRNDHNGHQVTYQPFAVNCSLSQEFATEIMRQHNSAAGRIGSTIDDLLEPLDKENFIVEKYNSVYFKRDEPPFSSQTDPLPDCMYSWPVIECISGNY